MEKKLQRNEQDKMLAGVCAGLADYFDVDVTWIRIAFVVAVLAGFSGVLAYIILWIAVPAKPYYPGKFTADYRVYEDRPAQDYTYQEPGARPAKTKNRNGRVVFGLLLILFGGFFLLDEFNFIPYWFDFGRLWPLVFIIPGILMIARAGRKERMHQDWEKKTDWDVKSDEPSANTNTNPEQPLN